MTVNRRELLKGRLARCHIASLVVQCLPRNLETTRTAIEALDGAEVPEFDEGGETGIVLDTELDPRKFCILGESYFHRNSLK